MSAAEEKSPHTHHRSGIVSWVAMVILAIPDLWFLGIPWLITVVAILVFGVPDDFRLAVFVFALIVVLMVGSAIAVYLVGKSLRRRK